MINYKLLQAIPIEVAIQKIMLEELKIQMADEIFTDILDFEVMDILEFAMEEYYATKYESISEIAERVIDMIITYLVEKEINSINIEDLLTELRKES